MFWNKKKNSNDGKGNVYYGLHFCPGVAEYREGDGLHFRVFLNENTIREMSPTFTGRPVFVHHVDEVDSNIDELRKEADGWVVESFYNQADGKHWAKFITVTDRAENAIRKGWQLSNCYIPKSFGSNGMWNGVSYDKEITGAEYEHLAIVPNPRYEESVILTPDEFKQYNERKLEELKRLSNNKETDGMKFNFFKKVKVENSTDLDGMMVTLPKSQVEVSIVKLINEMDEMHAQAMKNEPVMADVKHVIEVDGKQITIEELLSMYEAAKAAMTSSDDSSSFTDPAAQNDTDDMSDDSSDSVQNEEDKEDKEKEDKEDKEKAEEKRKNALERANRLRNAHKNVQAEVVRVQTSFDKVQLGKSKYGSN